MTVKRRNWNFTDPWVIAVIASRVASALYMLVDPMAGFVLTLIFDYTDSMVLMHKMDYSHYMYHALDKPLDWVGYAVELYVSWQHGLFVPMAILLLERGLGQMFYFRYRDVRIFIVFPNFFEVAFFWFVAARPLWKAAPMTVWQFWGIFFALCVLKMVQEVTLHLVWPAVARSRKYRRFAERLGIRVPDYSS